MKSFRLLSLAVLALLFFACAKDDVPEDISTSPESAGHRVSVEAALSELNAVLVEIDGSATRGGVSRRVGSVTAVKASDVSAATRSGEGTDIEELVYIANFENGEGYAILGADDRVPSVIAITEQGSLTSEELVTAANDAESGNADGGNPGEAPAVIPELAAYVAGLGTGGLGGGGFGGGPGGWTGDIDTGGGVPDIPGRVYHEVYGPWETWAKAKKVYMKWGQDAPYNYYTPLHRGQHCKVGCVAVAVGQIVAMTFYFDYKQNKNLSKYPASIGGYPVDWNLLFRTIDNYATGLSFPGHGPKDTSAESLNIANFLRGVGAGVDMDYGLTGSSSHDKDARIFFRSMGFSNVDSYVFSLDNVLKGIIFSGPIYTGSFDGTAGHSWVIDGYMKQQQIVKTVDQLGTVYSSYTNNRVFLHCNFGWGGTCDGYYTAETYYNPKHGPESEDKFDNKTGASSDRNYARDKSIILYNYD